MKNFTLIISIFFSIILSAQAPLENKKLQLNAGLGTSGWGTPVYGGIEYGIGNNITVGSEVSFQSYKVYNYKSSILGIQGFGNYHFNELLKIPSEWDFYAGLGVNYYNWTIKDSAYNYYFDDTPFGVSGQVGGRYFFNEKFAINLEANGGNATSGGKIGITYKL